MAEQWLHLWGWVAVYYINFGILEGLTFGALILLRPVTNRLLRPRHRVWLWAVGWLVAVLITWYEVLAWILPVPFSFRDLVVPRVGERGNQSAAPLFLPDGAGADGAASIALPGGAEIPLDAALLERALPVLGGVFLVLAVGVLVWSIRQERRLRRLAQQGERLDQTALEEYGITRTNVAVCLCGGLPASFVYYGHYTGIGDGVRYVICLQRELPRERMRLVLLHEMEHIRLRHPICKGWMALALGFHAWNPVIWLAYRLTCRDMELACDQAVLKKLGDRDRRDYTRALVELGSGRHLWGTVTSFGECDAALRVRRAVSWKPESRVRTAASLLLAVLMVLFFYCGGPVWSRFAPVRGSVPEDWAAYVSGGAWVQETARKLEEPDWAPAEVWSRTPEQLVVQDGDGRWWLICFLWRGAREDYSIGSLHEILRTPSLEEYDKIL